MEILNFLLFKNDKVEEARGSYSGIFLQHMSGTFIRKNKTTDP
jgi:hypothetical protein